MNELEGDSVANEPMYGTRLVSVFAVPHVSGFASGASAPWVKVSFTLLNGCSGFSENVAVSRPVVSFGTTEPLRRTSTPYRFDSALMYIVYGGPLIGSASPLAFSS